MSAHYPDLTTRDFDSAFAEARRRRLDFFRWSGKTYHTRRADGKSFAEAGADLCAPTQDERVNALVEALQAWDQYDHDCRNNPRAMIILMERYDCARRLTRTALRDMGVEGCD